MSLQKDIDQLIAAGVISQDTANDINKYYASRGSGSQSRLLIIFGILGAILVGLGIILIIAHNWDDLSKFIKLCIAFLPLVICQVLGIYVLLKQKESVAWRESVAVLLFFAVGTAISLVSQVYHLSGDLSSFLLTWMILCFPIMYVLASSVVSLLYVIGITWYAVVNDYWTYQDDERSYYFLLLLLALPFYYILYRQKPYSNFMVLHNWILPASVTITLGTIAKGQGEFLFIAYISLFSLFYITGNTVFFKKQRAVNNGYRILGSLGSICVLLFLSFNLFWESLQKEHIVFYSLEFMVAIVLTILTAVALYFQKGNDPGKELRPIEYAFIFFFVCFFIGAGSSMVVVLINLLILAIGVLTIIQGAKTDHLGILNYGLLIIAALVTCRFFDSDLSFVTRGILFVLVGMGFFFANFQMIKKRKQNVQQ